MCTNQIYFCDDYANNIYIKKYFRIAPKKKLKTADTMFVRRGPKEEQQSNTP